MDKISLYFDVGAKVESNMPVKYYYISTTSMRCAHTGCFQQFLIIDLFPKEKKSDSFLDQFLKYEQSHFSSKLFINL